MSDVRLDTIPGCVAELTACNQEVAAMAPDYAKNAGELKTKQKRWDRLYTAGLQGTKGTNADERRAIATAAVEQVEPGLAESIEELVGKVESSKRLFETLAQRASAVQSILALHRQTARFEEFTPRQFTGPQRTGPGPVAA